MYVLTQYYGANYIKVSCGFVHSIHSALYSLSEVFAWNHMTLSEQVPP